MKDQSVYELNKTQQYISCRCVRYCISGHCSVTEPRITESQWSQRRNEMVEIRFRTAKDNVDAVLLWADGKEHPMQETLRRKMSMITTR